MGFSGLGGQLGKRKGCGVGGDDGVIVGKVHLERSGGGLLVGNVGIVGGVEVVGATGVSYIEFAFVRRHIECSGRGGGTYWAGVFCNHI